MKKRLLSLLITLALIIGLMPAVSFAAYDPFVSIPVADCDINNGFVTSTWAGGSDNIHYMQNGVAGDYLGFEDVNFGTKKGVTFTIYYAISDNRVVTLFL